MDIVFVVISTFSQRSSFIHAIPTIFSPYTCICFFSQNTSRRTSIPLTDSRKSHPQSFACDFVIESYESRCPAFFFFSNRTIVSWNITGSLRWSFFFCFFFLIQFLSFVIYKPISCLVIFVRFSLSPLTLTASHHFYYSKRKYFCFILWNLILRAPF